ncbi:hypothetical protein [Actinocrispum wychmicini]|uniref:MYXO-CTERM domain-containing protein n=1 Tax=Actinocrispum wychmicini TaxID=1213861 RepID=A0A4R2JFH8_9PSEU|nr:hypothetical protein [Actinocrispum wychmicini]TCO57347.1 hypothetical protein EV192_106824 [Actinocrispum wychmicini]
MRKIIIVAALAAAGLGLGLPANADQDPSGPAAQFLGATASVTTDGVPVYYLAADFVRSGQGPVANLQYTAKTAKSADGRVATVWMAGGQVANIASGDDESRYAKAAGPGATVFREPQVNAWYALRDNKVLPLNESARTAVGTGVNVTQYQRIVHAKYADKLPGSDYAKSGAAGGYAPRDSDTDSPGWLIGGGMLATVLIAGWVMTRRRSLS